MRSNLGIISGRGSFAVLFNTRNESARKNRAESILKSDFKIKHCRTTFCPLAIF